jgi:hypothetical protein
LGYAFNRLTVTNDLWVRQGDWKLSSAEVYESLELKLALSDWIFSGKFLVDIDAEGQGLTHDFTKSPQFVIYAANWDQDKNDYGMKVKFVTLLDSSNGVFIPAFMSDGSSGEAAGVFYKLGKGKVLVEAGSGNYTSSDLWRSVGPITDTSGYEYRGNSSDDEDANMDNILKVSFRIVDGLNFGFGFLPGYNIFREQLPQDPYEVVRDVTFGAKYIVNSVILAAGANLKENQEKAYLSGRYRLLGSRLTLSADAELKNIGIFERSGIFNIGEKAEYSDRRWGAGITLKHTNVIHNVVKTAANDMRFAINSLYGYINILDNARFYLCGVFDKGLGTSNDKSISWIINPLFFYSIKGQITHDFDLFDGIAISYQYGVADNGVQETITNSLSLGFKLHY